MHCLLSLYDFLVEKGEQRHLTHVVFECRGAKEDKELELEFRRICDGSNPRGLELPFEILFADKKAMSSGLQLADLVARPVGLHVLRPEQPNRAFDSFPREEFIKRHNENKFDEIYENTILELRKALTLTVKTQRNTKLSLPLKSSVRRSFRKRHRRF